MNERVGVNGKGQAQPYHIGFELRLPQDWNGRLLYQGGGGNDGVVRTAIGPQATADKPALARGFAVVTTDAGHQGPSADFGFDPVARVDNAYNTHDKVVFNFDKDPARMDAHSWMFDTAADTELTGFKARGGKLLIAHGMADPIFSPLESEAYFKQLQNSQGGKDMSRLFQIPGMGHCSGGAATDSWDGLSAMVDWVEKGQAPEVIVAKGTQVFKDRTRPLCAYPKTAQYKGSGSIEDAANFNCQ